MCIGWGKEGVKVGGRGGGGGVSGYSGRWFYGSIIMEERRLQYKWRTFLFQC